MKELLQLLWEPTLQTIAMVVVSALISGLVGTALGVLLVVTEDGGVLPAPWLNRFLNMMTNVGRSIPFIILMVAIIPFTRWVVGTSIGTAAAMVPLVVGAIPYVGRLVEGALRGVNRGVIEAVLTMGATPWQVIRKAYLPEAVPALIRSFTVVTVTLVSYSAMAGTVGGGGLGDLAIRYGYQGFRLDVMVATVIVLIVMIQGIQLSGDLLARYFERTGNAGTIGTLQRQSWWRVAPRFAPTVRWGTIGFLLIGVVVAILHVRSASLHKPLRIGVNPIPHGEILREVMPILEKEGVHVQIIYFSDYIQPNLALASGDIDANLFQHVPFMDRFNHDHGTNIIAVAKVHIEPLGLYPGRTKILSALPDGAVIAIPNDPVNSGRGLLLLQAAGLIKLRTGTNTQTTLEDVSENSKHIKISELEAAQLPRSLRDVDAAVINTNYALAAKLNPLKDAMFLENSASPYANVLSTVPGKANDPRILALERALQSPAARQFILQRYQGAVLPAF
ncbi:D-methionine transport system substrate-binding protein [Granulicella pectinivorans]|uniref:D-methionine transport system substrate-binding protein n=1 Tax=Granulicella pectinivorans TaxID=474950 RepID=A0A1I6MDJ6_9BACT|nr:MetQ/NlpA family ABC transporter substrate-binding protein [Granulicella pectinivorans]SFS13826.1 D-methionine transport system substrate-binding protein [Granulicella pectinivorans]